MAESSNISRKAVVKCLGPRLAPFFKLFALFYILHPTAESSLSYCFFKCAPIVCLIVFVLMYGLRIPEKQSYSRKVLLGLVLSCFGDACLVWTPEYITPGIIFFALAHLFYSFAFGWHPRAYFICPILHGFVVTVCFYSSIRLSGWSLFINAMYGLFLATMIWRATAGLFHHGTQPIPWTSIARALGAFLSGISDAILSVQLFRDQDCPLSFLVLPTYYAAQMCIAVSVVDRQLLSFKLASSPVVR